MAPIFTTLKRYLYKHKNDIIKNTICWAALFAVYGLLFARKEGIIRGAINAASAVCLIALAAYMYALHIRRNQHRSPAGRDVVFILLNLLAGIAFLVIAWLLLYMLFAGIAGAEPGSAEYAALSLLLAAGLYPMLATWLYLPTAFQSKRGDVKSYFKSYSELFKKSFPTILLVSLCCTGLSVTVNITAVSLLLSCIQWTVCTEYCAYRTEKWYEQTKKRSIPL